MEKPTIHDLSPHAQGKGLVLIIEGTPRPKQSFRWVRGRPVPVTAVKPLTRAWARTVYNAASGAKLERGAAFVGPVLVSVEYRFGTPDRARWGRVHTMRPDADNLNKLLGDEIARAGLVGDDAAIQWGRVVKLWVAPRGAGASVMLEEISGSPNNPAHSCMNDTPGWLR